MVTRIGPSKPFRMYLGKWRVRKNLTQEQLALRVGTTKPSISRWENGTRDPPTKAIAALAYALDIELEQLFQDPDRPSADALLAAATPETRRRALAIVKTLVDEEEKKDGTDG